MGGEAFDLIASSRHHAGSEYFVNLIFHGTMFQYVSRMVDFNRVFTSMFLTPSTQLYPLDALSIKMAAEEVAMAPTESCPDKVSEEAREAAVNAWAETRY